MTTISDIAPSLHREYTTQQELLIGLTHFFKMADGKLKNKRERADISAKTHINSFLTA